MHNGMTSQTYLHNKDSGTKQTNCSCATTLSSLFDRKNSLIKDVV